MVLFNYSTKEITAKIVYYGPGLCGKTTNLQFVYDALPSNNKSKMLSLATKADRTLFFDFLPLDLGKIRGMRTRMQLYTVPGQVYYNSTRQLVLKGADGVVFVCDSQDNLMDANIESWNNLKDNLRKQGVDYRRLPVVFQYNKRDLPNALPIDKLDERVNELNVPFYESVATSGIGVEDTLKGITRLVLKDLMERYGLAGDVSEDEINIGPRPSGTVAAGGGSVWAEDDGADENDDMQEVPFLMSEPPAANRQDAEVVEVTDLSDEEAASLESGAAEVIPDGVASVVPADGDSDEIVFDTIAEPEGGETARPLPAESLVVAVGGAQAPKPPAPPSPPQAPVIPAPPPQPKPPPAPAEIRQAAESRPAQAPAKAVPAPQPPVESRPSFSAPVPPPPRPSAAGTAQDPGTLVKEVALPLNLTLDEVAGKRKIVLKLKVEMNILR